VDSFNRSSLDPLDDIPEARREVLITQKSSPTAFNRGWLILLGMGLILVGGVVWFLIARPLATATEQDEIAPDSATANSPVADPANSPGSPGSVPTTATGATATPAGSTPGVATIETTPESKTLLGHRQYQVADPSKLVALSENNRVKLKPVAAQKVEAMIAKARAEGVKLGVVSGYRTLEDQRHLFFDVKANRGQNASTRAEVSAPPGYSEHHTGYAVDFVDRSAPATDLEVSFETTPAFRWLQANAAHFGFELSFPKDNPDVSYEPWHWRFTGDQESLETFYQE
jgi:D-alanyl-D-alanine carboxypeptidase